LIDSRAVIDPQAELEEGVKVGPFSMIGSGVQIGTGTEIGPHVVINGPTRIGRNNRIYQFTSIGEDPQDMKYCPGEESRLEIGDRNTIREFATISRGTAQDRVVTRIGNDNLFMAYIHVAHDCRIGNHVIMANAASLGGHVEVDDWAILGGFTIVHQFCRIGAHSFCAMGTGVTKDIPPYLIVDGHPAKPRGVNSEGLRRRGFDDGAIAAIKRGYKSIYMQQLKLEQAVVVLNEQKQEHPAIGLYLDFLEKSKRSIVR